MNSGLFRSSATATAVNEGRVSMVAAARRAAVGAFRMTDRRFSAVPGRVARATCCPGARSAQEARELPRGSFASCALEMASSASGQQVARTTRRGAGFTLLEMCIVLIIMAVMAGIAMPAFYSAVTEHKIRDDGHRLALMVRTAMIQSSEQHRPYVIDLTATSMALHPLGELAKDSTDSDAVLFKDSGGSGTNSDTPVSDAVSEDVEDAQTLDSQNKLQQPDLNKVNGWMDVADGTQWVFQPGELCPATTVRIARGDAYLEMNFTALTGNIDSEKTYFP
jgi:prepilin-type N-terminal cleavage/methylation domain-containing protein